MKIVVPIKQVSQLHEGFAILNDEKVDPDFVEYELNEWDTFGLAAAADLARQADAEIVAVSVHEDAEPTLRQAVALGASRAVQIHASSEGELDALQVGLLLAEFVRAENADVVVCGVQSADAGAGAVPAALAGFLGWARVAAVLSIDREESELTVRRELPGGAVERLAVPLPVVFAIQSGSYEVPYPSMSAKMAAKRTAIEAVAAEDLLDSTEALANVRGARTLRLAKKESAGAAVPLPGQPAEVVVAIRKIIEEAIA